MPAPRSLRTPATVMALACLIALTAVPAMAQPSAPRLSASWKRIQSPNFVVMGDAGEGDLRSTLRDLEAFRRSMVMLFPYLDTPSPVPTYFVLFKSENAARSYMPRDERGKPRENVAGYFFEEPDARYMVAYVLDRDRQFGVIFHEYAHALIHQSGKRIPTWADEGLAEFYSTFRSTSNGAVIGTIQPDRLRMVASGDLFLSFDDMFTPAGVAKVFRSDVQTSRFYTQAWALVHYSTIGDRRGQFADYLQATSRGASAAEAFAEAYKTSFTDLMLEVRQYSRRPVLQAMGLTFPAAAGLDARPERMSEADALHMQGQLLLHHGLEDEAQTLLKRALEADPAHLGARVAMARIDNLAGRSRDAVSSLREAAAAAPNSFSVLYWLAASLSASNDAEAAVRAWGQAADTNPRSAAAWAQLSIAAALLGRNSQAAVALARATALNSSTDWRWARANRVFGINDGLVIADANGYIADHSYAESNSSYLAFLGALSSLRLKDAAAAEAMLAGAATALDANTWQAAVTRFLREQMTADALLTRASTVGEQTEAHAYIGIVAAIAGRIGEARTHLEWVRDHGSRNYSEYALAIRELARLDLPTPGSPGK